MFCKIKSRGFSSAIALNGKRTEVFRCKSKERGTRGYLSELRTWLSSLKDPSMDRNAIANMCGYSSANALGNFLRKQKQPPAE